MTNDQKKPPLTDADAMKLLGLRADDADDVASTASHAWEATPEGRRWDSARLRRWARVVGTVASGFAPSPATGSGGRRR